MRASLYFRGLISGLPLYDRPLSFCLHPESFAIGYFKIDRAIASRYEQLAERCPGMLCIASTR
jgi:hypothetical protein